MNNASFGNRRRCVSKYRCVVARRGAGHEGMVGTVG